MPISAETITTLACGCKALSKLHFNSGTAFGRGAIMGIVGLSNLRDLSFGYNSIFYSPDTIEYELQFMVSQLMASFPNLNKSKDLKSVKGVVGREGGKLEYLNVMSYSQAAALYRTNWCLNISGGDHVCDHKIMYTCGKGEFNKVKAGGLTIDIIDNLKRMFPSVSIK